MKWFGKKEDKFRIGIELYNNSVVEEKEDKRQFIKVHFNGVCQTFYKSSGINSEHSGRWYPTNSISIYSEYQSDRSWKNFWYITKKPWLKDKENRFGENKEIEFISNILSGEKYTGENKDFLEYSIENKNEIVDFLKSRSVKKLNNYEINEWIGSCFSYKWFEPYYSGDKSYIPDLSPKTSNFWLENSDGKLILPSGLFNNPKIGYELDKLRKLEKANYEGLGKMEKLKSQMRLKVLLRQLIREGKFPQNLLSYSELFRKRKISKDPIKDPSKDPSKDPKKNKTTVSHLRKQCREKGLVYDTKTKKCRESKRKRK